MADTLNVANRFLALARERGDSLTPMQLLKLTYIAHGWMLGLYGVPLITDEVQAWQYGPVIPRLYNAVRRHRGAAIDQEISVQATPLQSHEENAIQQTYDIYGKMSGPALSRLTHAAGTPWALTYREGEHGLVISQDIIEDHYQRLASNGRASN